MGGTPIEDGLAGAPNPQDLVWLGVFFVMLACPLPSPFSTLGNHISFLVDLAAQKETASVECLGSLAGALLVTLFQQNGALVVLVQHVSVDFTASCFHEQLGPQQNHN